MSWTVAIQYSDPIFPSNLEHCNTFVLARYAHFVILKKEYKHGTNIEGRDCKTESIHIIFSTIHLEGRFVKVFPLKLLWNN